VWLRGERDAATNGARQPQLHAEHAAAVTYQHRPWHEPHQQCHCIEHTSACSVVRRVATLRTLSNALHAGPDAQWADGVLCTQPHSLHGLNSADTGAARSHNEINDDNGTQRSHEKLGI
jgi:hypothetical protein